MQAEKDPYPHRKILASKRFVRLYVVCTDGTG